MKPSLPLDDTIGEGWLRPWIDGLRCGDAVASKCSQCGHSQFPPLRICPTCRVASDGWTHLDGGATVQFRTKGADGDFALVKFDGSNGAAVVRAESLPPDVTRGRLIPEPVGPPVMRIGPEFT